MKYIKKQVTYLGCTECIFNKKKDGTKLTYCAKPTDINSCVDEGKSVFDLPGYIYIPSFEDLIQIL